MYVTSPRSEARADVHDEHADGVRLAIGKDDQGARIGSNHHVIHHVEANASADIDDGIGEVARAPRAPARERQGAEPSRAEVRQRTDTATRESV